VIVAFGALAWILGAIFGRVPVAGGGLLVPVLIVAVIVVAMAFRALRRMTGPLDDLAAAAERIERGDYSTRVFPGRSARTYTLVSAFNKMSARLESVDKDRRAFLADAAHELRTPLSIIAGQIEAIEDGVYPADAAHLAPIHAQIKVLEQLIDDMRTVSLAEGGSLALNLQPTDLGATIDQQVAAFQTQATAAGIELRTDYPSGLAKATADEQRLGQVLANLLSNAVRHTPRGGHVTVSARESAVGMLEITIKDDGTGIAADLLPRVFDRFAKEDGSGGSGLGLAICKDLVEAMGGQIRAESRPDQGTTVSFSLPTAA
jgi:signal transduction histidine kinase